MQELLRDLLGRLLVTHAPTGDEAEMERLSRELLTGYCDEVWVDPNDNVIGKIKGHSSADGVLLMAHKDEISTIVRKIDEDGKIWMDPLGGCVPWVYGEGPFDLLGKEIVTGVLSVGSRHSSHLSPKVSDAKQKALNWELCHIHCKLNRAQLAEKGVLIGVRGCVARSRKQPFYLGDCVGGYGLDDKAGVAILILVAELLRSSGRRPALDLYLAVTSAEETGCGGGAYVSRTIPASTQIAIEIAPVAEEYPVALSPDPVILYKDVTMQYHKGLADQLAQTADEVCGGHQRMLVRSFGSDASSAARYGLAGRAGCIGFPTENTHGFEVGHLGAMENCARVLAKLVSGG
jgi:putative aminopeptidase FrvX